MNSMKQDKASTVTYFIIIYVIFGYYFLVCGLLVFELYKPVFSIYTKETLDAILLLDAGRGATSILVLYSLIYGMIMLGVGLLGFYCLSVQGVCELRTFAVILGVLSILKIIIGIITILISLNILLPLQLWGYMTINFMKMASDKNSMEAQSFLQNKYECCGVNNHTDYERFLNTTTFDISDASNCTLIENVKFEGCEFKVSESYICQWQLMGITSICVSLLEVIGIILVQRYIKNTLLVKRHYNPNNLPKYYFEDDVRTF